MSKLYQFFSIGVILLWSIASQAQVQTLRLKPLAASDDAEQNTTNGSIQLNSSDLELGGYDWGLAAKQITGIRFPNVTLPQGAIISKAYIQFSADETSTSGANITIKAQKGNALTFAATANNISSRPYTNASVNWVVPAWTVLNQRLIGQQTSDLKPIIEEAIQANWASGNALAFSFSSTTNGYAIAWAFDRGNPVQNPELVIEYSTVAPLSVVADKPTGTYYSPFSVALTSTSGAIIRYTTDGSTPTATTGMVYSSPITVSTTTTLKAISILNNTVSNILTLDYTFAPLSILADKPSGTYYNAFSVNLVGTAGASIRYTVDGSTPTATTGILYTTPIAVSSNTVIKAVSVMNTTVSDVLTLNYSFNPVNDIKTAKYKITTSSDDAEERLSDGYVFTASSDLELGGSDIAANFAQVVGVRFSNIVLPVNAVITKAYIQFSAKEISQNPLANIDIKIQNTTNAATFAAIAKNISSRTFISSKTVWNTSKWLLVNDRTVLQQTPDVSDLIREAISAGGWNTNMSWVFTLGSATAGWANAYSVDGGLINAPELVIEYGEKPVERKSLDKILYINEVAGSGSVTNDNDWVELYNNSADIISLDSVYITDDKKAPKKFMFSNKSLYAKSFVLVSANDTLKVSTPTTAAFGISASGETIYLYQQFNGVLSLIDSLVVGATQFNTSYGRRPDGSTNIIKFSTPTPAASNNTSKQLIDLTFSKPRGLYSTTFSLVLTAPAGTTIRYTTDGTFPSETVGTIYTAPISVSKSMVVKAIAYNATMSSGIVAHSYFFETNKANETRIVYNTTNADYSKAIKSLPIVSISTKPSGDDNPYDPNTYILSHVEYIDSHIDSTHANFVSTAGVRKFGQATAYEEYGNLKAVFKSDYESKKAKYPFFETVPGEKFKPSNVIQSLEFKAGQDRYSRIISERISQYSIKEMGGYALCTKYVNLFVNGKFLGVRTMRDDFKANNMEEYFGDDDDNYTEINYQDGNWDYGYVYAGQGDPNQLTQMRNLMTVNNYQAVKQKVEIDDYIKFMLMFCFNSAETESVAIGHNSAPNFTKYRFIYQDTDNGFTGGYGWGPIGPARIYATFGSGTGNLEFKTRVKDHVYNILQAPNAPLSANALIEKITKFEKELDAVVKIDANVLGYTSWKNEMQNLRRVMPTKVTQEIQKWANAALKHTLLPLSMSHASGKLAATDRVTITNPNAGTTVYYSINGDDVVWDNGIATWAKAYTAGQALPLKEGKNIIKARAYTNGNFGPLTEVTYILAPAVNITGVNYNPVAASSAEADKLEFVLVTNYGADARSVGGDSVTAAISFVFPAGTVLNPGETIMITKDLTKYPNINLRKFLWTSGKLANEGEKIVYRLANGEIINDFVYLPTAPWPTTPNAGGAYLKLKLAELDNAKPENWEAATISTLAVAQNLVSQQPSIKLYGIKDANKAIISAVVTNPATVSRMELEKFNELKNEFELIHTFDATEVKKGYLTYTDLKPYISTDNIYRLAMYRQGNTTPPQYSDVLSLDFSSLIDYTVYPNPTTDFIDIQINQVKIENVMIRIVNLYGQTIVQKSIPQATVNIRLALDNLEAGQYILLMDIKGKRSIAKKLTITK